MENKKNNSKKSHKAFIIVIMAILIGVFSFSAVKVISIIIDYKKDADFNESVQEDALKYFRPLKILKINSDNSKEETDNADELISVDFSDLKKKNANCFAWIYLPDTVINYPIVYTSDNEYYLRRSLTGGYLHSGTLFADSRIKSFPSDTNTIIYGHNVHSGIMFAPLVKYKAQSYYDIHPYMYLITEDAYYRINLFSGMVVKTDNIIYKTDFGNEEEFNAAMKSFIDNSSFKSKTVPKYGDKLVTLSTCSYEFDNARYVVIGTLERLIVER